jgi:hypothetical protein
MYVSFKIDQTRMPSGLVIMLYQLEVTAVTSLQKERQRTKFHNLSSKRR